jgi:hypothetical protein
VKPDGGNVVQVAVAKLDGNTDVVVEATTQVVIVRSPGASTK